MELRQSNTQIIRFGPFLDATDGVTPETGLTIAQADMQISKDGAAFAQKSAAGNATHDVDGWYSTTLSGTDVSTTGILEFQVNVSGALPVWKSFSVVTQSYFDSKFTGTFNNLGGTAQTADHTAGIADIPTVSEFNARTLVAASYFDPTADAVANVTLVATTTALTNVINAASIVASVSGNVDGSVDSVTGDTKQTADHTAAIADIPTVAEFNARTILSASYFDPVNDAVANVTLVATTTTNTDVTALNDFDPANDAVANVTLVATTTTNMDMVAEAPTFSQIWTTQLTESYASDGTAPTPAQALFITMQNLQSFSFAGTTQTVRQINDSTTAATYTLDDATNPTSKTRTS